MTETTVLEKIKQILKNLPESMQIEVLHYAEYLSSKYVQQSNENIAHSPQADNSETLEKEQPKKRDGFGIWKGKIWMSDDFDEPLADLEEYYPESNSEVTEEKKPKKRRSGILKGTFVLPLPDDFDEPLEEFEV